jgi:drug/metabolite transporter (DMT)-like permease
MSPPPNPSSNTIPLSGYAVLLLVCLLWGGSIPFIRLSEGGIPPLLMATARVALASFLLWVYARFSKEPVMLPRAFFWHGVLLGVFFGLTMLFLYLGLVFTSADRGTVFYSTKPFWVAIGAHFLVGENLSPVKIAGLVIALAGVYFAFLGPSVSAPSPDMGNIMEIVAALFFSATALYTKWMSAREKFNSYQTLFPMMLFSLPLLLLSSLLWERGQPLALHLMDLVAFGYQTIGAQFLAYVLWFWLIYRYPVGQLASFTFLNPLVGVILSTYLLGEHPPETLWLGLLLVAAGIVLVNWPQRAKKAAGH